MVSRLNRAGVELVPTENTYVQFGDVINLVGSQEDIKAAIVEVGNAKAKLQQVQMVSVFIGLFLGILIGAVPLTLPGIPTPIKLGLAGGPLVMAIVLSRIGSIGRHYWFMPPGANLALREFGLIVFLAIVGLKSGSGFFDALFSWNGPKWFICGAIITIVPCLIMGFVGRKFMKLDYFSLFGVLGGSTSNPLTIPFAAEIKEDNGRIATAYAGVYPMVMFLRIISPQILAIIFFKP